MSLPKSWVVMQDLALANMQMMLLAISALNWLHANGRLHQIEVNPEKGRSYE